MKHQLLVILLLFSFGNLMAQIVNIPDPNFKAKLLEADYNNDIAESTYYESDIIDLNYDGEIQYSEAQNIIGLNISFSNIADLTGIEAFTNLEVLACDFNDLTALDISSNTNLKRLSFGSNMIQAIDLTVLTDLEYLLIGNNQLSTLDLSQNINLVEFYLGSNINITDIDVSANINLERISISHAPISTVDVSSNINLRFFGCSYSPLNSLDLTQNINLESLTLQDNLISEIDLTQNTNLQAIKIIENDIVNLDISQCPEITQLELYQNQLTNLDVTQNPLIEVLECFENQLTQIDLSQNPNLTRLRISDNQLTSLDVTQNPLLDYLGFGRNQIAEIDLSQNTVLRDLYGFSNQLVTLDLSHNSNLYIFWMQDNPSLVYINAKNGNTEQLPGFHQNPNLQYICADEDEISWFGGVQGAGSIVINSYCSFEPGGDFNSISGSLTLDNTNDGCDAGDPNYSGLNMSLSDGTEVRTVFSDNSGAYNFYTETGDYTLTPNIENLPWFNVSPASVQFPFSDLNNTVNQDFCITANGVHNDLEIIISPLVAAQPGFDAKYQIVYRNKGNQTLSGNIDFTYDDSVLDLVSTSIVPDAQSSGNLSWNYTDLNPFESRTIDVTLNVNSPMETPAVNIDDELDFTASISPVSGDETPDDNAFDYTQIVIGSFDPNDITCLEGDFLLPDRIGEYLHYNIRFENTGTAAATFVVIKDVIDENFYDLSTLQVLNASHNMVTRIEDNTVEFFFDNINLGPNELGNVLFKIRTNNSLVVGDSVSNSAEIFFDFNFPIVTNVAETLFQVLSVDEFTRNAIRVYPNPAKNLVTIKSQSPMDRMKIYDIQGRVIVESQTESSEVSLDVSKYLNGVYFLEINSDGRTTTQRIIKN
ncbi:leucine-rich repeat domain-containing protein [Winogradskyella tangerina]|uniref:leucine-rich repeat domain-containing protein n=1 Tax=Winogradskyella tangerina TaxID=2023240 RepID=UPI0018E5A4FB|nr:T9SS type A sorting domain-containing protein [Winogradskyella tangerina]